MSGVKETKEALVGAMSLGLFLYSKFKDGVQMNDFASILAKFEQDPEFKAKIVAAYEDAEKINLELTDITFSEGIELASALLSELPALIAVLPAQAAAEPQSV